MRAKQQEQHDGQEGTVNQPDNLNPPYVPWKSFENFVATLKNSHPPDVIDGSVMPTGMDGGLRRQVRSALKFIGLTNAVGKVSAAFNELILAHGTDQWQGAVKEYLLPAYDRIIGDLPIEKATTPQLNARFRDHGAVSGQVLEKAVRFYLHALRSAGVKYSDYLSIRKDSPGRRASSPKKPKRQDATLKEEKPPAADRGRAKGSDALIDFPLHFRGKPVGMIRVAAIMDESDMALFDATVAVVKAYAEMIPRASKANS